VARSATWTSLVIVPPSDSIMLTPAAHRDHSVTEARLAADAAEP
jgi:hypothetical protein